MTNFFNLTFFFRIVMVEGYTSLPNTMKYYGKIENGRIVKGQEGAQIPFNFFLLTDTWMGTGTWGYKFKIDDFLNNMPKGERIQANWVVSFIKFPSISHELF